MRYLPHRIVVEDKKDKAQGPSKFTLHPALCLEHGPEWAMVTGFTAVWFLQSLALGNMRLEWERSEARLIPVGSGELPGSCDPRL